MDESPLKLLLIEDSPADAELAIRGIRKEGFDIEWDRVDCEIDLRCALGSSSPNLIISDFSMPTFDGITALRVAREMAPETPFIFLSGTIGEERAIDAIKRGATDYVLKDNPQRLVPAIRRALHEVKERQRAALLEQEKDRLMEMLEATSDYVAMTQADGNIIYLNAAWRKLAGIPTTGPIEKSLYNLLGQDVRDSIREQAVPASARHGPWHGETSIVGAQGEIIPASQVIIAHLGPDATPQFYSTIARDIRERKAYEERISHLANFDAITDLPNRNLLSDRTEQAIVLARRMNQPLALIIVGIDKFSRLIDSYGHRTGDTLLSLVASRLKGVAHTGDTVAHLGGGSFAILTLDGGREDVLAFLRRMRKAIQENFEIDGREIHCKVNIGVSTFPSDAGDAASLLHNADAAMHRAAESIGEGFQFYAATMTHDALVRVQTERDLHRAFDRGELRVFYQPQIDLVSGQMTGAEALVRWHHKEQEWISPSHFIPVAEDCGLILEIGKLTLIEACQQMTAMEREGIPMTRVAVNMSARQFHDPQFLRDVRQILEASGIPPAQLEIELTETVLVQDQETAISILNDLKTLGVQIAVDDFGTGYSSLSYLSRLPVDRLKIDCSFVHRLSEHGRDATIVQAIISLAHSLGLSVVAEGVETERQLAFLRHHSCDEAQGFLLARPMDAPALHTFAGKRLLKN